VSQSFHLPQWLIADQNSFSLLITHKAPLAANCSFSFSKGRCIDDGFLADLIKAVEIPGLSSSHLWTIWKTNHRTTDPFVATWISTLTRVMLRSFSERHQARAMSLRHEYPLD
jgi:hypothetical protein